MSCTNCSSDTNTIPNGCQNNGTCSTGGCDKLTVFDWLSNMTLPGHQEPFNHIFILLLNSSLSLSKSLINTHLV
ncbi:MAG TPA: hypothetical protein EYP87_01725, partial [Flavobacteriaceae bacterium]|nr:hypothetical protein [Flavobacteriaceae bacterium]